MFYASRALALLNLLLIPTSQPGHDGNCRSCQRASYQTCDNVEVNGVSFDGGYAEYALIRQEAAVRLPAGIDPAEVAPLLCAGVTVFNGIRKLHVEQGNLVAVLGLGGLGHMAVQYARAMGYQVAVVSSGSSKRDFALQLGAHHYIDRRAEDPVEALTKLGGAAIVVATAPDANFIGQMIGGIQPHGRLLILPIVGPIEVDTAALVLKGISVQGWPSGHALDSEEAVKFAQSHGIRCIIEKFPLSEAQKALEHVASGNVRFRAVLTM
jgi:D-arabinose 1-dehydrogenase-like Zn-dependent alcohol dehydrogenase